MYLVVVFHAGIAAFAGGFIAVDLFFVLSGFLVCHVLLDELDEHGRIRFARFYARRFRRLLPAALVAIAGTAAIFMAVASPLERAELVGDARAALLYFANWHFVAEASDYFAADGNESPFLHFWSLSVEEQYYFIFPVLLVGAVALSRRRPSLLPILLLVPLGASLMRQYTLDDAMHAYYGTDARMYQPLAGAAFAAWLRARRRPFTAPAATGSVMGFAALALFFALASSGADGISTSSRGLLATIVSIGIVAGLESTPAGLPARLLSGRAMQYLGDISYGTYLWHWPVILATDRLLEIGRVPLALSAAVISTALAALSHEIVERPLRIRGRLDRVPRTVVAGGLACSVVAAVWLAPAMLRTDGGPLVARPAGGVSPAELAALAPATEDGDAVDGAGAAAEDALLAPEDRIGALAPEPPGSNARPTATPDVEPLAGTDDTGSQPRRSAGPVEPGDLDLEAAGEKRALYTCVDGAPEDCLLRSGNGAHIHVIGDSHAAALVPAFLALAEDADLTLSVTTMGSCPWQAGLLIADRNSGQIDRCREARADAYERVVPALDPGVVVVASRALGTPYWLEEREPPVAEDPDLEGDPWEATSRETLRGLRSDGYEVVVVEPVPEARGFNPLRCLSGATTVDDCAFVDEAGRLDSERFLRDIAGATLGMATIDLDPVVCPTLPVCPAVVDGEVVRSDGHHLSQPFAEAIAPDVGGSLRAAGAIGTTP